MTGLVVVPRYAAVLALLFMALSLRVIRGRNEHAVALGTGGIAGLERQVRAHANFAEYVPFALLLLAMAELRGAAALWLNLLCLSLLVGRLLHAWGVSRSPEDLRFRIAGMAGTFAAIGGAALLLLQV